MKHLLLLQALLVACYAGSGQSCEDLLKKYAADIPYAQFDSCTPVSKDNPWLIMKAIYKVSGVRAKAVEKVLTERYGMEKLKFVCCGWSHNYNNYGQLKGEKKRFFLQDYPSEFNFSFYLSIRMFSIGTLRQKWEDIDCFYIEAEITKN